MSEPLLAADTEQVLSKEDAERLWAENFRALLLYARPDRSPKASVEMYRAVGFKIAWVFEHGNPTTGAYFTEEQANMDVQHLKVWAPMVGMRLGDKIAAAHDYQTDDETRPKSFAYQKIVHDGWKVLGFIPGAYGDKELLTLLTEQGYAGWTWLSQSTFGDKPGWDAYAQVADVVQLLQTPTGINGDVDHVRNLAVLS